MSTGFKPVSYRHEDALSRVSWDAFERLVADHYRGRGYDVEHVGTGAVGGGRPGADGGIDLILRQGVETIVVQCKHWNCWQVPHNDVHQLIGVMHTAAANGAIVITSGEFTSYAIEIAARFRHIRLIDGNAVRAMLGPIDEPLAMPATLPPWLRQPATRKRRDHAPLVAIAGAILTMAVAFTMLWHYYAASIQKAQLDALRTAMRTTPATPSFRLTYAPPSPFIRNAARPTSSINGRPAIVHDVPVTKDDIAAWEKKNAESMRILEKTTPEMP